MKYIYTVTLLLLYINIQAQFGEQRVISEYLIYNPVILSADMDNDGDIDIVSVSPENEKLCWYENELAVFQKEHVIKNGSFGLRLALADINKDSTIDIVYLIDGQLEWIANDGEGRFGNPNPIARSNEPLIDIEATDLDKDGDIDILATTFEAIFYYDNMDGIGAYSSPVIIDNRKNGRNIHAADIDNDGDNDILSMGFAQSLSGLYMYERMSDNTYQLKDDTISIVDGRAMYTADMDLDNDLDIVFCQQRVQEVLWVKNDGQGNFSDTTFITKDIGKPKNLSVSDFDNDGDYDIVVFGDEDQSVDWLRNIDSIGNFGEVEELFTLPRFLNHLITTDIDNDGFEDIIGSNSESIFWLKNKQGNTFEPPRFIPEGIPKSWLFASADIDNDGDLDIVSSSSLYKSIDWHENDGLGYFNKLHQIIGDLEIEEIKIKDSNGDGRLDIYYTSSDNIGVLINAGPDSFSQEIIIDDFYPFNSDLDIVDIDNDGYFDILYSYNGLKWLPNLRYLSFQAMYSMKLRYPLIHHYSNL